MLDPLSHNNTQSSQLLHSLTAAAVYFRHNIAMQPAGIDMSNADERKVLYLLKEA